MLVHPLVMPGMALAVHNCCVNDCIQPAATAALKCTGPSLQDLLRRETGGYTLLTYRVSAGHADIEGFVVHPQRLLSDVI
jgi:hypothetical protein